MRETGEGFEVIFFVFGGEGKGGGISGRVRLEQEGGRSKERRRRPPVVAFFSNSNFFFFSFRLTRIRLTFVEFLAVRIQNPDFEDIFENEGRGHRE